MFRASNDGGATFDDEMNLSNTTHADLWKVEISGEGADVIVTWWETNQTSDTPVARISTDGGETFGPIINLGINGTISTTTTTTGGGGNNTTTTSTLRLLPLQAVILLIFFLQVVVMKEDHQPQEDASTQEPHTDEKKMMTALG